jgi:beta-glucosidase
LKVAAILAREADVAIVMLASFAHEGVDRESLSFDANMDGTCQVAAPGQDSLVELVAGTGTATVVVATAPGAMLTPWRDIVDAIVYTGMPGQEFGNALADVLFGKVNPSARLSVTMPNSENEVGFTPKQYPGINLSAEYSENFLIGYRYYNYYYIKPAFSFGHGLSYTTFRYTDLVADSSAVSVTVTNNGTVAGAEIAQLYISFPYVPGIPPAQLKGFVKTAVLQPGQSQKVEFVLSWRDLSIWDTTVHDWAVVKGQFQALVGASSTDLRLIDSFTVW